MKQNVNNFHLITENQRLPNMLGQRLYNMLGQRLCTTCWANVCTTCWANMFWMSKVLTVLHSQRTLVQRKLQLKAQRWPDFHLLSGTILHVVTPVLLYGSEAWRTTVTTIKKIQTFINIFLRRILRIRWPVIVSNNDLWERTKQQPAGDGY